MFRTGPVTTQASQPSQKNLFLQSLDWEENSNVDRSGAYENEQSEAHAEIQDKDIVESLENEIQYWTDFSKVHYHPQSLYEICGLWTDSKDFNNYGIGREAFSGSLHAEQVNDRLRFFLEECDHPQVVLLHHISSYRFLSLGILASTISPFWIFFTNIQDFCEFAERLKRIHVSHIFN